MIVDDELMKKYLLKFIKMGIQYAENTEFYYETINNKEVARFLKENNIMVPHMHFLDYILENQKLTKCPKCDHYNSNIECPVIRCELCNHEWIVDTPYNYAICEDCIAYKTGKCNRVIKK